MIWLLLLSILLSMKILKYIGSFLFFILTLGASAQEEKKDFRPSEILFATDVVGLGKTIFTEDTKLEFHTKLDFHHYYLAGEFGISQINPTGTNFDYTSEGAFFRIGPQVNLMPYNKHRSSIFFGVMYARSSFSDKIDYTQSDIIWGDKTTVYANDELKARWYEANIGINTRLVGPIYLGYTLRFKFAKSLSGHQELFPLEIPGFGAADKGNSFGFTYQIIYKLRFRDKPIPKRPLRKENEDEKPEQ